MAKVTTYLLVSNLKEGKTPEDHQVIGERGFEVEKIFDQKDSVTRAVQFSVEYPIEENESMKETATEISEAFPESTVTLCEVEQRLGQIEHVHTTVFQNGSYAGEIEHGFLYNVGDPQ